MDPEILTGRAGTRREAAAGHVQQGSFVNLQIAVCGHRMDMHMPARAEPGQPSCGVHQIQSLPSRRTARSISWGV